MFVLGPFVEILVVPKNRLQPGEVGRGHRAVVRVGSGDHHCNEQPQRIDEEMPLAPLDFLASIVAPLVPADLRGLHRRGVDSRPSATRMWDRSAAAIAVNVPSSRPTLVLQLDVFERRTSGFVMAAFGDGLVAAFPRGELRGLSGRRGADE